MRRETWSVIALIGAAHPVAAGDAEIDTEAMEKIVNVLVEHAGVFAERRGQAAVEWAERPIHESETASQRLQPVTGVESLVGGQGIVRSPLDPEGTVWAAGELWAAVADDGPIAEGERVEIIALEGLRLRVRRSSGDEQ